MNVALMTCARRWNGQIPWCYSHNLPRNTEVFCDEEGRGPAWNLERIFKEYIKRQEDVLVVQDDLGIEPWFLDEVRKSQIPGELMTYCMNTSTPRKYYDQGFSYGRVWHVWGQANLFPLWFMEAYFEWTKVVPTLAERFTRNANLYVCSPLDFSYRKYAIDDVCVTACLLWMGKKALLTLPNLVQHAHAGSSTLRDKIPPEYESEVFGNHLLRPWDKSAIADLPPSWTLRPYIHPLKFPEMPPEIIDSRLAVQKPR